MTSFPIDQIKNEIILALKEKDFLIINSSPGSGKTTRVPLFLAEHFTKKIYILEPRRLAAKLAANFVAKSYNENVGQKVGHIFKYDKNVGQDTQIIFVTEGTFLRILNDPKSLQETDVVILDEFHERHVTTDMAFTFLLHLKKKHPHLKIIIMSATIDQERLLTLLGEEAKVLTLEQKRFPIEINYLENNTLVLKDSLEKKVLNAIAAAVKITAGHILVFLPGMFEIRKVEEILAGKNLGEILILHSEATNFEIDDSFNDLSQRKIILSTNIAESSVTIPGVRVVVDSGLHRTSIINHLTRLMHIELKKIGQSSAIQRAHRANREDIGFVYRLYPELDFLSRPKFDLPEIARTDLADLILQTKSLLQTPFENLEFLGPINENELKIANKFLSDLQFLNDDLLTADGKIAGNSPFPVRVAKILQVANKYDFKTQQVVLDYLAQWLEPKNQNRFKKLAQDYFPHSTNITGDLEKILLHAFFDQLAKVKSVNSHELIHQNGESLFLARELRDHFDTNHALWIILDLNNRNEISKIMPIEEEWLYDLEHFPIEEKEQFDFDPKSFQVKVETLTTIGAIVLDRQKNNLSTINSSAKLFLRPYFLKIFTEYFELPKIKRLYFLELIGTKKVNDFPLEKWIHDQLDFFEIGNPEWAFNLLDSLEMSILEFLDLTTIDLNRELPLTISLHDRRQIAINYDITNGPSIEAYIQDFYGLQTVPKILNQTIPVTISLLGPHKRALQVTKDLNSFWNKAYKEMYNELKREYPRHYWPLDPIKAKPILLLRNVQG